ncbi:MAG: hypothetical protein ABEL76_08640 [Bradymonadaceae bacterium]
MDWVQVGLLVGGGLVLVVLTHEIPGMCNDTSRLATAEALVEHGRFAIDRTRFEYTCDKIRVDGAFYSDKPPLLSIYLAGVYGVLRATVGWSFDAALPSLYYTLTLLTSGLGLLLTLLGVYRLVRMFGAGRGWSALTAAAACGATLMLPFSVVLSSHAASAPCLVWLALWLIRVERAETPEAEGLGRGRAAAIGGLAALAPAIEPLAVAFTLPMVVAFFWPAERRGFAGWAIAGAALPAIPHAAICWSIAGNPIALNLNPAYFQYEGSMHTAENLSGTGFAHDSLWAFLRYAYHSIFGYRGAVLYNPPAAVGAVAAGWLCYRRETVRVFGASLVGLGLFFALTLGFSDNYSGWTYGVRWHATPAPMFAGFAGAAVAVASGRAARIWRLGTLATGALGLALGLLGTVNPWTPTTRERYSFVEVFSAETPYLEAHLKKAEELFRDGHYHEARYQAEHALRRDDTFAPAWEIAVVASARLGDKARLRDYARTFSQIADQLDPKARRLIAARLKKALRSLEQEGGGTRTDAIGSGAAAPTERIPRGPAVSPGSRRAPGPDVSIPLSRVSWRRSDERWTGTNGPFCSAPSVRSSPG